CARAEQARQEARQATDGAEYRHPKPVEAQPDVLAPLAHQLDRELVLADMGCNRGVINGFRRHLPRMCAELAESAQYPVSVVEVREQRFQSFRDRQLVDVAQRLVSPEREKDVDGIAPPDRVQLFSE